MGRLTDADNRQQCLSGIVTYLWLAEKEKLVIEREKERK